MQYVNVPCLGFTFALRHVSYSSCTTAVMHEWSCNSFVAFRVYDAIRPVFCASRTNDFPLDISNLVPVWCQLRTVFPHCVVCIFSYWLEVEPLGGNFFTYLKIFAEFWTGASGNFRLNSRAHTAGLYDTICIRHIPRTEIREMQWCSHCDWRPTHCTNTSCEGGNFRAINCRQKMSNVIGQIK